MSATLMGRTGGEVDVDVLLGERPSSTLGQGLRRDVPGWKAAVPKLF